VCVCFKIILYTIFIDRFVNVYLQCLSSKLFFFISLTAFVVSFVINVNCVVQNNFSFAYLLLVIF
jgi:hypothetical protein